MAALILSSSALSFSTGSSLTNCLKASISSADIPLSSSCSFSTGTAVTFVAVGISPVDTDSTCGVGFSSVIVAVVVSVLDEISAWVPSFLLSDASCSFFFAAASRAASSSRMSSFCCVKTSSFSFRMVGSLCFSSEVATSKRISFTTSLSKPEMASASPVRLASLLSVSSVGLLGWNISSRRKKVRLIMSKAMGTFLLTLKSNHC
mmetsp:Transcript_22896/g.63720  ORF Transcript_22896/g.63720 Transcript_22896/m.63720 type:complete len:205 (+) Transcript_22896:530-1144(+)